MRYQDERVQADLQVVTATVRDGMKRTRLRAQAAKEEDANIIAGNGDADVYFLHVMLYPDLIAATPAGTLTIDGERVEWPIPFEIFLALPEALGLQWQAAAYLANPHWAQTSQDDGGDESKKKATTATSSGPTATPTASPKRASRSRKR